jgi:hypothetical protein
MIVKTTTNAPARLAKITSLPYKDCSLFLQDTEGKMPNPVATQTTMAFPYCRSRQKTGAWHKSVAQVRLQIPLGDDLGDWYIMDRLHSKSETAYEQLHDVNTAYRHWTQWKQEEKTAYP